MYRFLTFAIAVLVSSAAAAEEIPLKSIWALDMPETRDIRELQPKREGTKPLTDAEAAKFPVRQIQRALTPRFWPPEGGDAGSVFIVKGRGPKALRNAEAVFLGKTKRSETIPAGSQSIVFYAFAIGRYVHIQSVRQDGEEIVIQYQLVPHESLDLTTHFALIPVTLQPGPLKVKVEELPHDDFRIKPLTAAEKRRFISDSSEFHVTSEGSLP
jgi:hypothetical protein